MPDDPAKRSIPAVMDVGTFHSRFGTSEACWSYLRDVRWGSSLERFTCPECGGGTGWWLKQRRLVECRACYRQTSVTAGTVFHGARTPLWKWFWAIYQLAQSKKGIAALTLAKQISVSYSTAWLMLLKLRRAMRRRTERYVLQGLVEVDETYLGGEEPGRPGRPGPDRVKKVAVAVAVELIDKGKPQHVAMASVKRVDGHGLKRFARAMIAKGSTLRTDGLAAYGAVARSGYEHESITTGGRRRGVELFPWVHTFIANMKRMIQGTHHWVSSKHVDGYLAEFSYRCNRRWIEATLFDRLVVASLDSKAVTNKELVAGAS